jgi:hypothetical protein
MVARENVAVGSSNEALDEGKLRHVMTSIRVMQMLQKGLFCTDNIYTSFERSFR